MANSNHIYGLHAVKIFLQRYPERVKQVFVQKGRESALQSIIALARTTNISIQVLSREALNRLSQEGVHQGVVIVIQSMHYSETDIGTILDTLTELPFLLILDGVQDPHNLGACLRSANAAGVHAVIVPKDRAVLLTSVVYKAASGAAEATPLIPVTNLARTLMQLKERGIWVYGASDDGIQDIYTADLRRPIAWVLGAEGIGLRRLTRETCDALFVIPMSGMVPSLNVSVAAGICLFEAVRQRKSV
jgi:23S rRNA (guanosine2251-2'-O)-methyltransferase